MTTYAVRRVSTGETYRPRWTLMTAAIIAVLLHAPDPADFAVEPTNDPSTETDDDRDRR
jgi:hypothetical protein